jgi:hypothetical protein
MKNSSLAMVVLSLFAPAVGDAQELYRATRSLEEQRAISQISQAEYYARMALRSLEASEKLGKAPYFDYQRAREDIGKVLDEFKIYLKGDESTDLPPAVPLIVDGRYFSESIKSSLAGLKAEEVKSSDNLPAKNPAPRPAAAKTPAKSVAPATVRTTQEKEIKLLQPHTATALPSPVIVPQSSKAKRDKIEEILKKGL